MKFRKLLGGGLLAAVLALGGVAGLATHSESKSANAYEEGCYYYVGVENSWNPSGETRYIKKDGSTYTLTLSFVVEEDKWAGFKFIANGDWNDAIEPNNTSIAGTAVNYFTLVNAGGDNNFYCKTAGTYKFTYSEETLYVDIVDPDFYYVSDDTGWSDQDAYKMTVGVDKAVTMSENNKFKIKIGGEWDHALGGNDLGDNYYGVFTKASGDNPNAICLVAHEYYLKVALVNHEYKIVPVAKDAQSIKVYVLDKYHDRLTDDPCAHYFVQDTDIGNGFPGNEMSVEVGNIYKIDIWNIMTGVVFSSSNGTYQTIDLDLTGKDDKCLILDHSETDGKWSSNTWVSLEVAKYIDTYMHFADSPEVPRGTEGEGKCASEGWYVAARNAYQASSFAQYREELCTLDYVVARLEDWAKANSATFTPEGGFVPAQRTISLFGTMDNSTPIMLVVIISVVSLTAVGGYIFLKRRKEN